MRFAFVPIAVLAASLSLAGTPSASIDPSANYFKIDMSRPPAPPTPVYVVNFPDAQAVTGTVSVTNFPAVQIIGGTVNVGNLPLTNDGSVRVSSGATRQMVVQELLEGPLDLSGGSVELPISIDTTGYSSVGFYIRADGPTVYGYISWQWSDDEPFESIIDSRTGSTLTPCQAQSGARYLCNNPGGKFKIRLQVGSYPYVATVSSVRVYLFP